MKKTTQSILLIAVLALSVPLIAQTTEEPVTQPEPTPAEAPAQEEVTMEDEQAIEESEASGEEELPQTASPLALLILVGAGAGVSAYGIKRSRR